MIQKQLPLFQPLEHHETLHSSPHGTVIYWQKQASRNAWIKIRPGDSVPQLIAPHAGKPDRYVSVNEFDGWRMIRLLRSLRACYVDIDGCTDLDAALDTLLFAGLPAPNLVVFSGRGLHLYWLLEPVPAKALPVWQRIQNTLLEALKPIGADPVAKDCTRMLRLIGSVHGKTGATVEGRILNPVAWSLPQLANEVLGERKPGKARIRDIRPKQSGQRGVGAGIYQRWHLVYKDLLKIADAHWFGGVPAGHQDTWLFLSSVALSWFAHTDTLAAEIEAQAKMWTPDWKASEVHQKMGQVIKRAQAAADGETVVWNGQQVDPRYRFRRQTLWAWCRDMVPPDLLPELRAIVPDDVAKGRKLEADRERWREAHGSIPREQYEARSLSKEKPWERLGMSRATWYRQGKPDA